jgi:hypothetical protein
MKMIAHAHGDERYAQYSNELWPNDPIVQLGPRRGYFKLGKKFQFLNRISCLSTLVECIVYMFDVGEFVLHMWIKDAKTNYWSKAFFKKFVVSNG